MAPWLVKAAISAGANILGGLFGLKGANDANRQNLEIARQQNELNYRMFQEQNEVTDRRIAQELAYNAPTQQRQRLEEAGLNPALAMGNISTGTMTAQTSATPAPAAGANMQNAMLGLQQGVSDAGRNIVDTYMQTKQSELMDAQKANIEANTASTIAQNKFIDERSRAEIATAVAQKANIEANTEKTKADTDLSRLNAKAIETMTPLEAQKLTGEIKLAGSQLNLNAIEASLKLDELQNMRPQMREKFRAEVSATYASVALMHKQGLVADANVAVMAQSILESRARSGQIQATTRQIQQATSQSSRMFEEQIKTERSRRANLDVNTQYRQKESDYFEIGKGVEIGSAMVKTAMSAAVFM